MYWRTLYSVHSKSEFSSRVCLRSPLVLLRKSIEHQVKRTPQKVATSCTLSAINHMCIAVLPRTCTEHRNITRHIERLSLVTNTWMRLPNLRRSQIDYKFSIVYYWHWESPNHPDSSPRAKNKREIKKQSMLNGWWIVKGLLDPPAQPTPHTNLNHLNR